MPRKAAAVVEAAEPKRSRSKTPTRARSKTPTRAKAAASPAVEAAEPKRSRSKTPTRARSKTPARAKAAAASPVVEAAEPKRRSRSKTPAKAEEKPATPRRSSSRASTKASSLATASIVAQGSEEVPVKPKNLWNAIASTTSTPSNPATKSPVQPASFSRRFFAFVFDALFYGAVVYGLLKHEQTGPWLLSDLKHQIAVGVALFFFDLLSYVIFGCSLGKYMVNLRVIEDDGLHRVSFLGHLWRRVAWVLNMAGVLDGVYKLLGGGAIRTAHDGMSNSVVTLKKNMV